MSSSAEAVAPAPVGAPALGRFRRVLLASHGTEGARAAEAAALAACAPGGLLGHLHVVPEFWKGMMGDDWLNNVATRIRYGEHLEGEIVREVADHVAAVAAAAAAAGLRYADEVVVGKPAECLVAMARRLRPEVVVIGAPRPATRSGLRSRMELDVLARGLAVPLVVVPHPAR